MDKVRLIKIILDGEMRDGFLINEMRIIEFLVIVSKERGMFIVVLMIYGIELFVIFDWN